MESFKAFRSWPPWIVLFVLWHVWSGRMVKLSDATLTSGRPCTSNDGILKEDMLKKVPGRVDAIAKRDIDQQVVGEIRSHFPELGHVDCCVRMVMGLTLFGEIKEKELASVVSGQRITTAWWHQLRLKWQRVNAPEVSLSVKNPSDYVAPPLITALTTAVSTNTRLRSAQPLLSQLTSQSSPLSQKAVVGLFWHSLSQHPSTKLLTSVIHIMKVVARLRLQELFRE